MRRERAMSQDVEEGTQRERMGECGMKRNRTEEKRTADSNTDAIRMAEEAFGSRKRQAEAAGYKRNDD